MSECNKCNGSLFVCENHPDQEAHQCKHCGGAGMPCECTEPVSEWISVEDRLPEKNKDVLVFERYEGISRGWISNLSLSIVWVVYGVDDVCHVTHWMPLPNPPQES